MKRLPLMGSRAYIRLVTTSAHRLESGLVRLRPSGGAQVPYLNGALTDFFDLSASSLNLSLKYPWPEFVPLTVLCHIYVYTCFCHT